MSPTRKKTQLWLGFGGLLVVLLLAAVFTLGSLDLPFQPRQWNEVLLLYALSTFIVAALLVFGLILTRSLLRLWAERRATQFGSRFKTKMVLGAMAISLLPVIFLFYVSWGLLNRTLARWFPRPLEIAIAESQELRNELAKAEYDRMKALAARSAGEQEAHARGIAHADALLRAVRAGAEGAWSLDKTGRFESGVRVLPVNDRSPRGVDAQLEQMAPKPVRTLLSGAEVWEAHGTLYLAARSPMDNGVLVVAKRVPDDFLRRYAEIEKQLGAYELEKQHLRAVKRTVLMEMALFTVLLLFSTTWFALFLSKQVTVPIQALGEGTREVSAGNFDYQVQTQAQDELGILVQSFNKMTAQLGDSRRQINEFTRTLQAAVQELDRRRKLMEAILENIPTGVLSLDESGAIMRINSAATSVFGEAARSARTLEELVGEEAARGVQQLMRRSLRMGTASKELQIALAGRVLRAAVTVSSLGPRRSNPGFVVVVDDLTELLRAQKAAAWQEVAQRIAHEIKNPLTPIQLSAQRLRRYLERQHSASAAEPTQQSELAQLVGECSRLIEREVATLESLVDEFSQFARFPTARLAPADPNAIVAGALEVFNGRLEGITVRTEFAAGLPTIKADAELLHRVLVNLIDNAAESLEGARARELALSTRLNPDNETVEIAVADTGRGISPEDKDKLFLPHFSTKDRGTGLGLAIASRIVAEHNGTIRVEDNSPAGARFVIQLPVAEVPAAPLSSES